tara:strand:+ start:126 stop:596 length:471 start_codon:yes stop_codon:yes gene_type:complete
MKRTGSTRTLRGSLVVPAGGQAKRNLILDDGRINIGYKVTGFHFWSSDMIGFNNAGGANATLLLSEDAPVRNPRAQDNREIAWAAYTTGTGYGIDYYTLVDPNHIVVRDLNIIIPQTSVVVEPSTWNYMINIEEYDVSDVEAIISIIKEESQDVVD